MDGVEGSDLFALSKWQKSHFVYSNESETTPGKKADALRGILNQVYCARACNSIQEESEFHLAQHYLKLYSSVIDNCNTQTGLNNYAEGALSLCANKPNESAEWKSSLTPDNITTLKCVQDLVSASKLSASVKETVHPDEIIKFKSKPTSSGQVQLITAVGSSCSAPNGQSLRPVCSGQGTSSSKKWPPSSSGKTQPGLGIASSDGQVPNARNSIPYSNNSKTPLFRKIDHAQQPGSDVRQLEGHNNIRGGTAGNAAQRGRYYPAGQGHPPPGDQRSWCGRSSSGDGSLFDGPASMKRKTMSSDGDIGHPEFTYPHPNLQSAFSTRNQDRYQKEEDETGQMKPPGAFKTAKDQLAINNQKKYSNKGGVPKSSYGTNRKVLGTTRRGLNSKFVPPIMNKDDGENPGNSYGSRPTENDPTTSADDEVDPRLKNIEPKMIELITNEIMDHGPPVQWSDIAGLEFAKTTIKEIVVWPMLRPDIFSGLRGPPKGLLLFGPPGTGKTLIGKCIASQSGATFFSISASSLTSKWVGEGEKMVRALFAVARCNQPAVIFIDEIDSLLSQRSNDEHESSRRIKTEFLVQLDGATTNTEDRLLVVGATNRPQEIDEAARRRLVKRLYIPLPEGPARKQIIVNLLAQQYYTLSDDDMESMCQRTEGYSGADMANLCREAALGPIRAIQGTDIQHISADQVRPILHQDFIDALQNVRPSVTLADLDIYLDWNKKFGSGGK